MASNSISSVTSTSSRKLDNNAIAKQIANTMFGFGQKLHTYMENHSSGSFLANAYPLVCSLHHAFVKEPPSLNILLLVLRNEPFVEGMVACFIRSVHEIQCDEVFPCRSLETEMHWFSVNMLRWLCLARWLAWKVCFNFS